MDDKILNQVAMSAVYQARAARLHKKHVLALYPHEENPLHHVSHMVAHFSVLSALCFDQISNLVFMMGGDFSDYEKRVDQPFGEWYGNFVRESNDGSYESKKLGELILDYFGSSALPIELRAQTETITHKYLGWPENPVVWTPSLYRPDGTELGVSELWLTSMDELPIGATEFFVYVLTAQKPDANHMGFDIGGHPAYVQVKMVTEGVSMHHYTYNDLSGDQTKTREKLETILAMPLAEMLAVSSILKSEWRDCISFRNCQDNNGIAPVWNSNQIYLKTGPTTAITNRGAGITVGVLNNFLGVKRYKVGDALRTSHSVGIAKVPAAAPVPEAPVDYLFPIDHEALNLAAKVKAEDLAESGKQKSLENETQKVREDLASGPLGTPGDQKQIWLATLQPFGKMEKVLRVFTSPTDMSIEEKIDALNEAYNKHGKEVVTITRITEMTRAMLCASLPHPLFIDFS